ncbi:MULTISPECIES: MFS transporter [unclassified Streptomyces]|uniref:MFS transporter n=1 Tax=unclassified Streptomyces TaxID=2593676 RepID=UPI0037B6BEA5
MTAIGSYRAQLGNKPFRRYFIGESVSSVGDAMTDITIVMLAIDLLPADERPMGIAVAAGAYLIPSMVSGVLMARRIGGLSGRTMLLVDNVWRGALLGLVALLAVMDSLSFTWCAVLLAMSSVTRPLNGTGARAIVRDLAPEGQLFAANSLVGLAVQSASLIGPVTAGFLCAWFGPGLALGLDALSFLFFAGSLLLIPRAAVTRRPKATDRTMGGDAEPVPDPEPAKAKAMGVLGSLRVPGIGALFGLTAVFYLLYGPFVVGLPLMAEERSFGLSTGSALGILWSAFGLGAVVGGVVAGRFTGLAQVRIAALSAAGWGVAMFIVAMPVHYYVALLAMFLGGLSYAPYGPIVSTVMQRELPPAQLNEVSSYYGSMTSVASPLGTFAGGAAVGLLGASNSILTVGVVLAAVGVLISFMARQKKSEVTDYSMSGSAG